MTQYFDFILAYSLLIFPQFMLMASPHRLVLEIQDSDKMFIDISADNLLQ